MYGTYIATLLGLALIERITFRQFVWQPTIITAGPYIVFVGSRLSVPFEGT
jgi:hypothetical protein